MISTMPIPMLNFLCLSDLTSQQQPAQMITPSVLLLLHWLPGSSILLVLLLPPCLLLFSLLCWFLLFFPKFLIGDVSEFIPWSCSALCIFTPLVISSNLKALIQFGIMALNTIYMLMASMSTYLLNSILTHVFNCLLGIAT